jgi:hypothetical protein
MYSGAPLLAVLGNPIMLGWLAAASAPLIIHLLNRRKYREAPWAAMQYLLAAIKKNARRVQLEQWLLLALRTLLIALVVVAIAEPGLREAGIVTTTAERTHRIIVLDGSFSMDYKPTGVDSYFRQAGKLAERIVDQSREGDGYSLVLLGTPSRTVIGLPLFRRDAFPPILAELVQPHGAGDLTQCLNEVDRVIASAKEQFPQIKRREVYFLTDLSRRTWSSAAGSTGSPDPTADPVAEFQARCERWGPGTTVGLVDVGLDSAENVCIADLASDEPYAVVGVPVNVRAVVRNHGKARRTALTAVLRLDGRKIDERTFDVDPGAEVTVAFDAATEEVPREPGQLVYEVDVTHDRLELDDRRRLALEVKPSLRVLVVHEAGPNDEESFGLESLETAIRLKPGAEGAGAAAVEVELDTDDVLQRRDLAEFDCVFLVGVRRFTPAGVGVLHNYVRGGGGLVWMLGSRVDAAHYDALLAAGDLRVLPARLGPVVTEPQYKLNPLKYEHRLISEFRGQDKGNLLNTPVYRYYRLQRIEGSKARTALEFLNESKDPFIVSESFGLGRSLMVATGVERSWTTLPLSPGFVPLVQEMLSYASGGRTSADAALVGEPIAGVFPRKSAAAQVQVTPPQPGDEATGGSHPPAASGGRTHFAEVVPQGELYRWTYSDTTLAGTYRIAVRDDPSASRSYVVNVDPSESDLTKLSPARFTEKSWTGVRFVYANELQDFSDPAPTFVVVGDANPIHRWLLMTALAAALAESWLAGRIGRRRL